jgi:predicted DNA-binding transcriptional regulator YafY
VPDRLERLINLTATLLDTRRALTLEELAERVEPRYPESVVARRRQFERDKETLRELGIPISVEGVDAFGSQQAYRIRPEDYYLSNLDLTDTELAALHVAVTAVELAGDDAIGALHKLGGVTGQPAEGAVARVEGAPALPAMFAAATSRSTVVFEYNGEVRRLDPYGVVLRHGHWYVVGHDHDRHAVRRFRVDRIDGEPSVGPPASFERPPLDINELLGDDPIRFGEDQPVDALVLVDAPRARMVVARLGDEAVRERRADGSVVVALAVVNRPAFRTWVLDLLDHAEVLGPPELRADMRGWLDAIATARARPGARAKR